jgi:hypothetical protein
LNSLIQLIT